MELAPVSPLPAHTLPDAGTLTFLFTDVEGSTALWEHHEATMRAVTAHHDALLDALIVQHGGRRVKERGEGDSIFAIFPAATAAVAAALAMQQALQAEPWPDQTPIRVRMGLHTGTAQLRAGDYYGPVVNRCARIRGLGHGGQVLLSATTAALVREALPAGASLRALGAHRLKGITAPEEVFQICHPDLPSVFPPLLSPQAPRHNLPQTLCGLIGREAEQGEVLGLLAAGRLVTLVGSGGVGKTRLALAVAAELVDQYPDGVWLVELAALAEPGLVPGAVAQALGVREEPGRSLLATLGEHLRERRLLLVLDNCEHLVAACAALAAALLRDCAGLRLLATSREGLELAGERRYRVPSLPVPDLAHLPAPERLAASAAVALFVARARERRGDFALTAQNARAVAQVCARLDGIPLAIELAAARVGSLAVEGIAARLDDRFRLLTGGARDALPHQRTLRAALDWSYDLLSEPEQRLLDRLSVFAGGWTLAAAEVICAGDGVEDWEVLDLLGSLVNKSLVQAAESGGEVRYGLLETMRQYGQERLAATGGDAAVRARHLQWYLGLAEEAEPRLTGPEQAAWLDRLEVEHDNLRAALGWARERSAEEGLRLAGALWLFWQRRGNFSEGRGWLKAALTCGSSPSAAARAMVLNRAGALAYQQGDYGRARALCEESLTLRRELGDRWGIANSLNNLGNVAYEQGDHERAQALGEESLALRRELSDKPGIALSLLNLGNVAHDLCDYERARTLYEESLALQRELGDRWGIATSLNNLAGVVHRQGENERALTLLEESLTLTRELGDKAGIARALGNLGRQAWSLGDYERARTLCEEGLALRQALGDQEGIAWSLELLATVAALQGQPVRAARLLGAAEALRQAIGAPLPPSERAPYEQAVAASRQALGAEALVAAWEEGRAMPLDVAVALALERHADGS